MALLTNIPVELMSAREVHCHFHFFSIDLSSRISPSLRFSLAFHEGQTPVATDQAKWVMPKTKSFRNAVLSLWMAYESTGNASFLRELSDVLEEVDDDLQYLPVETAELARFMALGEEDKEFDAERFVATIGRLWSDVNINKEEAELIRGSIYTQKLSLSYRSLKPFLAVVIHRLRLATSTIEASEFDVDGMVKDVLETTNEVMKAAVIPRTSMSEPACTRILMAIRDRLQEIVDPAIDQDVP